MANTMNIRGTKNSSFQIGRIGPTIHQGTQIPLNSFGIDGDVFLVQDGTNSSILIKRSSVWDFVSSPSSGGIGNIAPSNGTFIVGNGSQFVGQSGDVARTSLGLGIADDVVHNSLQTNLLTVDEIVRGSAGNVNLFTDNGTGTIEIGGSSGNVKINGNLEVLGNTTFLNSNNLLVADRNITVNRGGNFASSLGAGLSIEANNSVVGYLRVSESDNSVFELKAPTGSQMEFTVLSNSQLTMDSNLSVLADCIINQNLSQTSDVGFGSLTIGSPTGGNQGTGTLNATGLFINGVAVTAGVTDLNSLSDVTILTPAAGQILQYNGTNFVNSSNISVANVFYVGTNGVNAVGRGSINQPFASIQYAIDNTANTRVIKIAPGEYTENLSFTAVSSTNIILEGWGVTGSHPVTINGHIVMTGNFTRVRMKDLRVQGQNNGVPTLSIVGTQGRHYFENVTMDHLNGSTQTVVSITGAYSNWIEFNNSTVSGNIILGGTPSAGARLTFNDGNLGDCDLTISNSNWAAVITGTAQIRKIIHSAGLVALIKVGGFNNASGFAIDSSATLSASNLLALSYTNMTRPNFSYGLINKTGNCGYYISHSNRDVNNDILTGSRISFGDFVEDISANRTPVNYSSSSASLADHLDGIDIKLGDLSQNLGVFDITSPQLQDVLYFDGTNFVNSPRGSTSGVQAWDAQLDQVAAITPADNTFIVGNGTAFVGETGATARTSLGVGTGDSVQFTNLTVSEDIIINKGSSYEASLHILKNQTTNNTPTELFLDGINQRLIVPNNTTWMYEVSIIARRTNGGNEQTGYKIMGIIDRQNDESTTALIGDQEISFSQNLVPWTVRIQADSINGSLKISVVGENGKNINWTAFAKIIKSSN